MAAIKNGTLYTLPYKCHCQGRTARSEQCTAVSEPIALELTSCLVVWKQCSPKLLSSRCSCGFPCLDISNGNLHLNSWLNAARQHPQVSNRPPRFSLTARVSPWPCCCKQSGSQSSTGQVEPTPHAALWHLMSMGRQGSTNTPDGCDLLDHVSRRVQVYEPLVNPALQADAHEMLTVWAQPFAQHSHPCQS